MGRVQTSVMIDEDKRALAKQRGIKLQDLLDDALNTALELEVKGKAQLEIEKENLLKEIEIKEKQKDDYLKKYNIELERLENDKNEFLATNQSAIAELNLKLQFNTKALNNASEEQRALEQLNDYKQLVLRGVKNGAFDGQVYDDLIRHAGDYRLPDLNGLYDQAKADLYNVFYDKMTIDDITLDYDCFKPVED